MHTIITNDSSIAMLQKLQCFINMLRHFLWVDGTIYFETRIMNNTLGRIHVVVNQPDFLGAHFFEVSYIYMIFVGMASHEQCSRVEICVISSISNCCHDCICGNIYGMFCVVVCMITNYMYLCKIVKRTCMLSKHLQTADVNRQHQPPFFMCYACSGQVTTMQREGLACRQNYLLQPSICTERCLIDLKRLVLIFALTRICIELCQRTSLPAAVCCLRGLFEFRSVALLGALLRFFEFCFRIGFLWVLCVCSLASSCVGVGWELVVVFSAAWCLHPVDRVALLVLKFFSS